MNKGIYADIETSKGLIVVSLEFEKTPGTVGNFVSLAEGNMKNSHKEIGKPYYDGLAFHRVINDFMIQGGCPLGNGTGDPGYKFDDEFHKDLKHDSKGILSMANAGPGTNGSQLEEEKMINKISKDFEMTDSGLRYELISKNDGPKAKIGDMVKVHYKGQLIDGTVFDSSYKRNQPIEFKLGVGQVIKGWDEGISLLRVGEKARFVIPSNLAYGEMGAGGVIPPNATLVFDVELVEIS